MIEYHAKIGSGRLVPIMKTIQFENLDCSLGIAGYKMKELGKEPFFGLLFQK